MARALAGNALGVVALALLGAPGCVLVLGNDYEVSSTGSGPQVVASVPANGATQGSIQPYIEIRFDRPLNPLQATGHVRVTTTAGTFFAETVACPGVSDPTCLRAGYPPEVLDANGTKVESAVDVTVTLDAGLPGADGSVNETDTVLGYRTFEYDPAFYDDTNTASYNLGGIAYVPMVQSLYYLVPGPAVNAPSLRRLPLDASLAPTAAEWITVADLSNYGTGSYAYGLDYTGNIFNIAAGDWNLVLGNEVQGDGTLLPTLYLSQPTLPPPDDVLDLLSGSTVLSGSQVLFSHSCCTDHTGVLRYDAFGTPGAQWSVFLTKDKMGNPDAFAAWATEVPEPTVYVVGDTAIYKVLPDGTIVNQQEIPLFTSFEPVQMRTDSAGRLYFAYSDVLSVFDTSGSNGFTELAHRTLLSATRFDLLEEDPSTVHVFYAAVDGEAMLGEQLFYW